MGNRLKQLRESHNYSKEEISQFLDINLSLLEDVESDDKNLELTKLLKVCDLYNVDEDYLLYGKINKKDECYFKKDNNNIDLETIAKMNRIMNNLQFMKDIYMENYEDK